MNTDYWEKRSTDLEILIQKKTDESIKTVNKTYAEALNSINERIKRVFDAYAVGNSISETEALKLLNTKQTREFRQKLIDMLASADSDEARKEIIKLLDAPAYANRISRLEALSNDIYAEGIMLGAELEKHLKARLIDIYEQSYYRRTFDIQQYTGEYYDFERLSSRRLKEAIRHKWKGSNYSERVWNNTEETARQLKQIVINGIMTGQSSRTMTDALTSAIGSDSDSGARFKASRLIRTEVNYISGQATQRAYEEAGFDEYVYLATLDKVTCTDCGNSERKSCAELDGKHFKIKDAKVGVNKHPMHPFCRCSDYPYIPGKKIGTRAARDENGKSIVVPDNMSYDDWRKMIDGKLGEGSVDTAHKMHYNNSADKKQYEKYKQVLRDVSPKTIEEFKKIKYGDSDAWKTLKYRYRILNQYKIDSGYISAKDLLELDDIVITEKRENFSSKYKRSGNIAGAYIDGNKEKLFFAHSGISFDEKGYRGVHEIALLKDKRRFKYIDVKKKDSTFREKTYEDTEAKLFEYFADEYEKTPFSSITMLSERGMCDSCLGVMQQFIDMFPGVTVNVISNKKVEGNVWKHRRR